VNTDLLPALLLDNLATGLIAIGSEGEVLYLNRVALDVFDLKLYAVQGGAVADLFITDDPDWLVPVADDRVGDPRSHREVTLRVGDKEVVIESSARTFSDRRGRVNGVLVMFTDISDSAEDEEFRRTAERLAHLGELSAVVAHEIRNPLTGIRTTIQFLEKKLDAEHEMRGSINRSEGSG
jgi:PAS domain S-box-containing protein